MNALGFSSNKSVFQRPPLEPPKKSSQPIIKGQGFYQSLAASILNQYDPSILAQEKFCISVQKKTDVDSDVCLSSGDGIKNHLLMDILNNGCSIDAQFKSNQIPAEFLCPISRDVMDVPIINEHGMTYDRDNFKRWCFDMNHHTDPLTNAKMDPIFYCNKPVFAILEGYRQIFENVFTQVKE